ncbi:hypothetical protein F4679DRAFT_63036 [Xylaria curta]|nr:hypothetical protein F4679DRAFT_63036 [Xylaria curta]
MAHCSRPSISPMTILAFVCCNCGCDKRNKEMSSSDGKNQIKLEGLFRSSSAGRSGLSARPISCRETLSRHVSKTQETRTPPKKYVRALSLRSLAEMGSKVAPRKEKKKTPKYSVTDAVAHCVDRHLSCVLFPQMPVTIIQKNCAGSDLPATLPTAVFAMLLPKCAVEKRGEIKVMPRQ